ncbi:hypothetical protein [Rubinisphaera italica]|uniref:Uncharacterized protein n=1 Tax=Rubinisphaera italica TaxID=2527969 RepID=A0A5C5XHW7_9PLAN|nr:hypothetical protein [Rubinisphaera italica]TWT61941.1 hypothetical protein Pan54_26780 [Rubinisphaera italica]
MITNDQFIKMLELLLKKSRENQVRWQKFESIKEEYGVRFRDGSFFQLTFTSPDSSPDYIQAQLISNGTTVMSCIVDDSEPNYELLSQLRDEAYRSVTKWDSALENIMSELADNEVVGVEDDSVPF